MCLFHCLVTSDDYFISHYKPKLYALPHIVWALIICIFFKKPMPSMAISAYYTTSFSSWNHAIGRHVSSFVLVSWGQMIMIDFVVQLLDLPLIYPDPEQTICFWEIRRSWPFVTTIKKRKTYPPHRHICVIFQLQKDLLKLRCFLYRELIFLNSWEIFRELLLRRVILVTLLMLNCSLYFLFLRILQKSRNS